MRSARVGGKTALLLVVAVGAALRAFRLGAESLWLDELLSLEGAKADSVAGVVRWAAAHATPPGYELLLHPWVAWFGDAEWVVRLPSALAGILAIVAIQRLGEQLYSRREGLVAALLLAVSWQPVFYSQEARPYSLLILLSIVSFELWTEMVRSVEEGRALRRWRQVAYALCAGLLVSLHFYGSLVVGVQGLGIALGLARQPRRWAPLAIPWGIAVLAFLPGLPIVWSSIGWTGFWLAEPSARTLRKAWRLYFYKPGDLHRIVPWVLVAAVLRALWERRREGKALVTSPWAATPVLLAWLLLPAAVAFAWSKLLMPILTPRHLLISLPAAYLLFARSLTFLIREPRLQLAASAGLALLLVSRLVLPGGYYSEPYRAERRAMSEWVAEREPRVPGGVIVAFGGPLSGFDHYLERAGAVGRAGLLAGYTGEIDGVAAFVEAAGSPGFWYLAADLEPSPGFLSGLGQRFDLAWEQAWHGAAARYYCVHGRTCPAEVAR